MIDKLERLGQSLRTDESHDALMEAFFTMVLSIDSEGNFLQLSEIAKTPALAEAIGTRTRKYIARTLLDKSDYTLGIDSEGQPTPEQHGLFLEKLRLMAAQVPALEPLCKFYGSNSNNGLDKAKEAFGNFNNKTGNIAFLINAEIWAHAIKDVHRELCRRYDEEQNKQYSSLEEDSPACSICGQKRPIPRKHDLIKNVSGIGGQSGGAALVSYNAAAFESYGLESNANASICAQCAKNYTGALNYLLSEGVEQIDEKTKKAIFLIPTVRIWGGVVCSFGSTTAPVWFPKNLPLLKNQMTISSKILEVYQLLPTNPK